MADPGYGYGKYLSHFTLLHVITRYSSKGDYLRQVSFSLNTQITYTMIQTLTKLLHGGVGDVNILPY